MRVPVTALLVVVGCAAPPAAAQRPAPTAPPPDPDRYVHTIVPRDTLIAVSRTLLADPRGWQTLQRVNKVRNPRRLRPAVPRRAPGSYGVRIAIVNVEGTEGPFGPVQTFEVAPIRTRSWWWILEPAAAIAAGVIAAL